MSLNNENTIIFTIARMNPPTSGHMLLIKTMILKALELDLTQINLILSGTVDNKKNPLTCSDKRFFLLDSTLQPDLIDALKTQMIAENPSNSDKINAMEVKIVCMNDQLDIETYGKHPIFKCINYILMNFYGYPKDGLNMILMIGEDRIADYDWIQTSLQERTQPVKLDIVGLPRPAGAMSATFMRELAMSGNYADFEEKVSVTGLDNNGIQKMYDDIRSGLTASNPKKSKTTKVTKGGRKGSKKGKKGKKGGSRKRRASKKR